MFIGSQSPTVDGFSVQVSVIWFKNSGALLDSFYLFHWLNWLASTEPIERIKPIKPIKQIKHSLTPPNNE
jgi:hypothetical protein